MKRKANSDNHINKAKQSIRNRKLPIPVLAREGSFVMNSGPKGTVTCVTMCESTDFHNMTSHKAT